VLALPFSPVGFSGLMDRVSEDISTGKLPNPEFRPANYTGLDCGQAPVGFARGREKAAKADPKNSFLVNFFLILFRSKKQVGTTRREYSSRPP
jgi:hypothetical protein